MVQSYPDDYDGILAIAPAINYSELFGSLYWPQQVIKDIRSYRSQCEIAEVTSAAITACDGLDGIIHQVISVPERCQFDLISMVGKTVDCNGSNTTISSVAARVVQAFYNGPRETDGSFLWYGYEKGAATLDQIALGVQSVAQTNEAITIPIIPPKGENPGRDMLDTQEYYSTSRGQHPNSQNKMALRSVPLVMAWNAWAFADFLLTQPLLIVVGEELANKWHADRLFELLNGKNKGLKRVVWPNAYHIDFYDKEEYVDPSIEEIDTLFKSV